VIGDGGLVHWDDACRNETTKGISASLFAALVMRGRLRRGDRNRAEIHRALVDACTRRGR
jgi:hypothetical protein